MKKIELTKGRFTIVDDADFEWLSQWNWCARSNGCDKIYAGRVVWTHQKQRLIYMHRLIFGATAGEQIDHKNGNSLDNRRENLRLCTSAQNRWNQGAPKNNTSGFKGVSWRESKSKWEAQIRVHPRYIYLGLFSTAEEAGRAYSKAAKKYHGVFSRV